MHKIITNNFLFLSFFLLLLFIECKSSSKLNNSVQKPLNLNEYLGTWSGKLHIYKNNILNTSVPMSLKLSMVGSSYSWILQYEGQMPRNYVLKPDSLDRSKFLMDEINGIILQGRMNNNILSFFFEVDDTLLDCQYTFLQNEIIFSIHSGNKSKALISQDSTNLIKSLDLPFYQFCSLKKKY